MFAKCDDFIEALCKRLEVEIPPFVLYRRACVSTSQEAEGGEIKVEVMGLDVDEDLPYSFIKVSSVNSLFILLCQFSADCSCKVW